jgi:DNA-binding IclR family transcriptional regulator
MTQATVNQALKRHTTLNELRKSNQPHPAGTVAELAEKLGLSKSEVRRRKAAGLL